MSLKKTILAVVAVLIVAGAMLAAYDVYSPKAADGSKTITVIVHHLDKSDNKFELTTNADSLREALESESIIKGIESDYGMWIQTVDDETADESLEQWWSISVNGEFAQYVVDEIMLRDGDIYEFTLNVGY